MSHNCGKYMDLIIICLYAAPVVHIVGWGGDLISTCNFYRPQVCITEA